MTTGAVGGAATGRTPSPETENLGYCVPCGTFTRHLHYLPCIFNGGECGCGGTPVCPTCLEKHQPSGGGRR